MGRAAIAVERFAIIALMVSFDPVADDYDDVRPRYPAGVFDALEPLAGLDVLEGGAGTGIATRELLRRGAAVVAFDIGSEMLRQAVSRSPMLTAVVADAGCLPVRDETVDLVCFAQSWHWVDLERGCQETARVLRPLGRWAGWWSHARADGAPWFDAYWDLVESEVPGAQRAHRDIDWGETLARSGLFEVNARVTVGWARALRVQQWVSELETHSYISALGPDDRRHVLGLIERNLNEAFPSGDMRVPYETWLWMAKKR